jgi:uncharacterized protein YceH (UPF0502 family)
MRTIRQLDLTEERVLGALMEKEQTTPDYYPMTVNSLIAACNQKSNREPVTELSESEILDALERLRLDVLAWRSEGARVERWSHSIVRRLGLDAPSKAILTLLLLRGPQTPGQLRSRSGRMHSFGTLADLEATLRELAAGDTPLVVELDRQPGMKESRWAQRLGAEPVSGATVTAAPPVGQLTTQAAGGPVSQPAVVLELTERLETLERRVEELAAELARLQEDLGN